MQDAIAPPYLRLHVEDETGSNEPQLDLTELEKIESAFEKATGWSVANKATKSQCNKSAANYKEPVFKLFIDDMSSRLPENFKPAHRGKSDQLIDAINNIYVELQRSRQKIVELEADLATAIPVVQKTEDEGRVARLLTSLLSALAESVGCERAAIYLLDDHTEKLHMRCAVGLPGERLTAPPRELNTCVADVQALSGNAIAIEDASLLSHWNIPEPYPAAACVPISSMSTPLGTLWLFSDSPRDFCDQDTNLMEIFAGRIAAELERLSALQSAHAATVLVDEQNTDSEVKCQLISDQQQRLPSIKPIVEGWEIDGWSGPSAGIIHDWAIVPDARLAMMVASVHGNDIEKAITSAMVQSSFHSLRDHCSGTSDFALTLNESLWTMLPGCPQIGLMFAMIDPASGKAEYFVCGDCRAVIADSQRLISLERTDFQLGRDPNPDIHSMSIELMPGQSLVATGGHIGRILSPVQGGSPQQVIYDELPFLSGCEQWLEWVQNHVADSFDKAKVAHSSLAVIHRDIMWDG